MRLTILILIMSGITTLNAQDKEPSNKHFWHSTETTASSEAIWSIWTDVSNWKEWDTGLEDASMEEEFSLDAKGTIISLKGRKSKFKVVEFIEGESYTYKTKLPLGSLYVKRYLTTENGSLRFTHEVWFKGLSACIFSNSFGKKFREMLPVVLENIKQIAENK